MVGMGCRLSMRGGSWNGCRKGDRCGIVGGRGPDGVHALRQRVNRPVSWGARGCHRLGERSNPTSCTEISSYRNDARHLPLQLPIPVYACESVKSDSIQLFIPQTSNLQNDTTSASAATIVEIQQCRSRGRLEDVVHPFACQAGTLKVLSCATLNGHVLSFSRSNEFPAFFAHLLDR